MEPKANPVATGALAAGIVPAAPVALALADLAALAAPAPVAPAALAALAPVVLAALADLARVAPVVSVVLAPVALVALADPAPVVTADRARRVDLVAALLASLGIPRTAPDVMDPVAMDPVVARVVRISVLNR
jgi:hypothetical protein